jgi:hypothetical protein
MVFLMFEMPGDAVLPTIAIPFMSAQTALLLPIILTGLAQGAMIPVAYELCAELAHPYGGSISGGLYQLVNNGANSMFVLLAPCFSITINNFIMAGTLVATICMMPCIVEEYRRDDCRIMRKEAAAKRLIQLKHRTRGSAFDV